MIWRNENRYFLWAFQSITIYELYVLCLRSLISFSILASVLVSAARLLTLAKYVVYMIRTCVWKHPEDYLDYSALPEDAKTNYERFPHVAVQVWLVHRSM
jgi:hypothetical protein